jgi:D-alanine-D-alanine ligase
MPRVRRVGVIFGGRSGEHEVSLASAAAIIAALETQGHDVVPIGIARDGRWVVGGDPMRALAEQARGALPSSDDTGSVKKALADRAESVRGAATTSMVRSEPAGSVPAELRQGLDVVFVALHGPYGEDGTIQGLLEMADVPYVGAGVLASAVGMDKAMMKTVFQAHGLPIVEHVIVLRRDWRARRAEVARHVVDAIGVPCFVKPCNLGSSVGITKVAAADALPAAIDEAARHDRKVIVERAIGRVREIEVSVLGNDEPQTSLPGEIVYEGEWYDYATKYAEGQARLVCPAPLTPALTARMRELAVATYRAIDAAGMARVDFFLDGQTILVNEINTIPGFTSTSGYAKMWEATGLAYPDLVQRLVDLALERHEDR